MSSVTFSGSGELTQAYVKANIGLATEVIIENYTSIGKNAFLNYTQLQSVTISDSVTIIGESTFWNCTSLTSVTILNSVNSSGVSIGVTSIGVDAFFNCTSLSTIEIPDSVQNIEENAFNNCTSLTSVTIGNSVTSIGKSAFESCSFVSIVIPISVIRIRENTFGNSKLTSVTIANGQKISEITFKSPASPVSFFGATVTTALPKSSTNLQTRQPGPTTQTTQTIITLLGTKYPIIFEVVRLLNKTGILNKFENYIKILGNLRFLLEKKRQ
jgi:hypothetical protein